MQLLVIAHEHRVAHILREGLEREDYQVTVAYDGQTGYEATVDSHYDLILLDTAIRSPAAAELCRVLRHNSNHTPVILLADHSSPKTITRSLDAGADSLLIRPFSLATLLTHIRATQRTPLHTEDEVLSVDGLRLDIASRTVARDTTPVDLTTKEFNILAYLLRHKNKAVSKEALMTYAWDLDATVMPNNVEVFINYLRNKIDRPFHGRPLIETARGFGYIIKDMP